MRNKERAASVQVGFEIPAFPAHRILTWPLIACAVLATFSITFFTVLPYVNAMGHAVFGTDSGTFSFDYFLIPFTALDTCILLGYFKAARAACAWLDRVLGGLVDGAFGRIRDGIRAIRTRRKTKGGGEPKSGKGKNAAAKNIVEGR